MKQGRMMKQEGDMIAMNDPTNGAGLAAIGAITSRGRSRAPVLAATAAVLLAGSALGSQAHGSEPIRLGLGGFMEQWFGYADQDDVAGSTKYAGWDAQSDSEVFVQGETTLDNGIVVGAYVEFEADTSNGGVVDVSNLYLASERYGKIELGAAENESWVQHNGSLDVGIENQDGDYGNWVVAPGAFTDRTVTGFNDDGTAEKINYYSPRFWGLAASASYVPHAASAGTQAIPNTAGGGDGSAWTASLTYERQVGDLNMVMNASYGTMMSEEVLGGLEAWSGGVALGYGGFTLGGSYANLNDTINSAADGAGAASQSGYASNVGLVYATGPYAASITWLRSETEGVISIDGEDEKDSVMLSGSYALGPGVDLKGSVFWVDYDDETAVQANNNDGWGAVAGLSLAF